MPCLKVAVEEMTIHDIADKYAKVYTESFARCGGTLETTPFARLLRAKGRKKVVVLCFKKILAHL